MRVNIGVEPIEFDLQLIKYTVLYEVTHHLHCLSFLNVSRRIVDKRHLDPKRSNSYLHFRLFGK